jgi:hypothetical protein
MAQFVHLAPDAALASIRRVGLKAAKGRGGLYAMPATPDFYASHQWLRELRIGRGQQPLYAVYFRVPGATPVAFGPYGGPHVAGTADEAVAALMLASEPLGFETILMASVPRDAITSIKPMRQVTGWRYSPRAKGRQPCACPACLRPGEPYSQRIRARFPLD